METLEIENRYLKEQVRDLTMRLSAVKVIVNKINPLCAEKLQKLLEECEGCKGEES
jgi:hypothetical protein